MLKTFKKVSIQIIVKKKKVKSQNAVKIKKQ